MDDWLVSDALSCTDCSLNARHWIWLYITFDKKCVFTEVVYILLSGEVQLMIV